MLIIFTNRFQYIVKILQWINRAELTITGTLARWFIFLKQPKPTGIEINAGLFRDNLGH